MAEMVMPSFLDLRGVISEDPIQFFKARASKPWLHAQIMNPALSSLAKVAGLQTQPSAATFGCAKRFPAPAFISAKNEQLSCPFSVR
jgi:hypothetical protein